MSAAAAALTRDSERLTREIYFVCNYCARKSLFMALLNITLECFISVAGSLGPELALAPQLQELIRHMDCVVISLHDEVTTPCGSSNDNHIFSRP